jgi:hypothetical protein
MKRRPRDEEREQRITMEIIVDAYTPEEQAMGWAGTTPSRTGYASRLRPGAPPSAASRRCASATRSTSSGWPPKRSASTRCSS